MEFRKMVTMTLRARQQKRHRVKNRLLDSVGEGESGMIERIALKHVYYHT